MKIIDTIHIKGLQNFESQANTLHPAYMGTENDKLWTSGA